MGDLTLLLLHETTSRTLARAWSSIWDSAIPLVLLANTMFSGSSVISPAVIGTHLMTCHGNLHMSAETEAERLVQAESPKFPFLSHKNLGGKKKSICDKRTVSCREGMNTPSPFAGQYDIVIVPPSATWLIQLGPGTVKLLKSTKGQALLFL